MTDRVSTSAALWAGLCVLLSATWWVAGFVPGVIALGVAAVAFAVLAAVAAVLDP